MNLGRQDEAIKMIDDLITQYPEQTDLLLVQSNVYIAKKDPASAAAALEILRATGKANTNPPSCSAASPSISTSRT
ncbi:MAG: hypothetical protein J6386_05775 [Candidatus Synoicihabitans palmerolidicus]|nr:hypothetical protein [Candidatus Synoicihabitans palmerolidicus]